MKIYVIVGESGSYSDRYEELIEAHTDHAACERARLNMEAKVAAHRPLRSAWFGRYDAARPLGASYRWALLTAAEQAVCKAAAGPEPKWAEDFPEHDVYAVHEVPLLSS